MSENANDFPNLQVGETVKGQVVKIEDSQVLVDIGYKTEGVIPLQELSNLFVKDMNEVVKLGDELTLIIKKVSDDEVILSKKAIDADNAWKDLEEKLANDATFDVTIKEVVKGGLVTDVGVRGFIPASMVETHYVEDFSGYVNQSLSVKIVDLDREKNRIILSHRAVIEQDASQKKAELLDSLAQGQVLEGTVSRITDFGVFVDLGGIDGLVHISQLAHEHVDSATNIVTEGEKVKVEVLSVDRENERISLSRKNTLPGPWDRLEEDIHAGQVLEGIVKRLVNFGAFVEVKPGVEGLVHISQIANRHIGTPQEVLKVGQKVNVKVLDINVQDERLSLSIREIEEEQEAKEFKQYEKEDDHTSFQLGDLIGNKLDKYK